jgi:hypothetical protein
MSVFVFGFAVAGGGALLALSGRGGGNDERFGVGGGKVPSAATGGGSGEFAGGATPTCVACRFFGSGGGLVGVGEGWVVRSSRRIADTSGIPAVAETSFGRCGTAATGDTSGGGGGRSAAFLSSSMRIAETSGIPAVAETSLGRCGSASTGETSGGGFDLPPFFLVFSATAA